MDLPSKNIAIHLMPIASSTGSSPNPIPSWYHLFQILKKFQNFEISKAELKPEYLYPISWKSGELFPLFVVFVPPTEEYSQLPLLINVASNFRNNLKFCFIDSDYYRHFRQHLGLEKTFSAAIIDVKNEEIYVSQDDVTQESMSVFAAQFISRNLKPFVMSQDVKHVNDLGSDIDILTAENFQEKVLNSRRNYLVLLHYPWCGYCKLWYPVFDELATELQLENVTVGTLDLTLNDMPQSLRSSVVTVPTILYYSPGNSPDNSPKIYSGQIRAKSVAKFVRDGSSQVDEDFFEVIDEEEEDSEKRKARKELQQSKTFQKKAERKSAEFPTKFNPQDHEIF
eukprot:TRINITY_DN9936_c0_g1_i1.p1 TRINITY_DN9936_c0_g1~~TRINITY_DN9936_c0_g1_i1.p1  ORF type:complete len:339 (+),score=102.92 TRINITY_DN9936_c0_g1_i1:724-1740(+)